MIADATTPVMNVPMKPMNAFIIGVCIGAAALIAAVISASDFPCCCIICRCAAFSSLK